MKTLSDLKEWAQGLRNNAISLAESLDDYITAWEEDKQRLANAEARIKELETGIRKVVVDISQVLAE